MNPMRNIIGIALIAACLTTAGATAQQYPYDAPPPDYTQTMPAYAQPIPQPYAPPPAVVAQPAFCQPYTDNFSMGTESRITHGMACFNPDGSWVLHPAAAPVTYVQRGGLLYLTPLTPFAVIMHGHHHHDHDHDHDHDHHHDWHH